MPVEEQTPFNEYTGNGVTTVFPYQFQILASGDLAVSVNGAPKSLVTDYTLDGVGNQAGGQITFTVAPASGANVLLAREMVLARDTDYQTNGDLREAVLDRDFNRIWLVLQGISANVSTSLRFPFPEQANELPATADRINRLLSFDAVGQPTTILPTSDSAQELRIELADPGKGLSLIAFQQLAAGAVPRDAHDKARELGSIEDFGGVGDGSTSDQAAVDDALASGFSSILANDGKTFLVNSLDNPMGVKLTGGGKIVKNITGGQQQLNTYVDDGQICVGREFMFRAYFEINIGSPTIPVFLYGDSTVADGYTSAPFYLSNFIPEVMKRKGVKPKFVVTNRGVPGTSTWDMNAIADLTTNVGRLMFIKYGINDSAASDPLNTLASTLRSKLAELRAHPYGGVGTLAIVLVGPNATSDTPNGRDEKWYEKVRGIYVQAARDYGCVFFDTYAYLKESRGAAGLWMDNPYDDGRAIHPTTTMQPRIWGGVLDELFRPSEMALWAQNSFTNTDGAYEVAAFSDAPDTYHFGTSMRRASGGWPFDGVVITHRQSDNIVMQFGCDYADAAKSVVYFRKGRSADLPGGNKGWDDFVALTGLGESQTWTAVTHSPSTVYENTTGRAIAVSYKVRVGAANAEATLNVSNLVIATYQAYAANATGTLYAIVPAGGNWRVDGGTIVFGRILS